MCPDGRGPLSDKSPGRPSKYREEFDTQAYKLCLLGATDAQLADFFGVSTQTINSWKNKHPTFLDALNAGKHEADAKVAESLYHRALGYSHKDVSISNYRGQVTITPITKHYPPDTTACIFWLKNRDREHWRDRHEVLNENHNYEVVPADPNLLEAGDDD